MSNLDLPTIIAHLDCSSGVSGDKFLGALIDAGSSTGQFGPQALQDIAYALAPECVVSVIKSTSHGIGGVRVEVIAAQQPPHRSWSDIQGLIRGSGLPEAVIEKSLRVFGALAEAEAIVHDVAVSDVHFHEVGAIDSIVDIVGVCAGIEALGIEALYATPPAAGSGVVETSHGPLAVPAPATAKLLTDHRIPTTTSTAVGELTTPTGAALLTLADAFGPVPPTTPYLLGYGLGTRDIGQPNVCRLIVGELNGSVIPVFEDETVLLETNIDHITPEAVAFAGEELLAEGALDVWVTPIAMKKGRAALTLSVLTDASRADELAGRIVALTGSLGVRTSPQRRLIAQRESFTVDTPWGEVGVKHGAGRFRPEHDAIAKIAREHGLVYYDVLTKVTELALEQTEAPLPDGADNV